MAFPLDDLPDPSTWFSNTMITSALMKSNIIDAINLLPRGFKQSGTSASTVTLAALSPTAYASLGPATFTINQQRRLWVVTQCEFDNATGVAATYDLTAGYNTGSSATIGSVTTIGKPFSVNYSTVRPQSAIAAADVLLTAGTYTAYGRLRRISGGAATDTATNFYTAVIDIGAS